MTSATPTVGTLQNEGLALLAATSRESRRDAAALLCHVLRKDRAWVLANPAAPLTLEDLERYHALIARRRRHEPMQYILGEQEFFGMRFAVSPAVLIPRPETEHLVEAVLARLPRDTLMRIADVGTGSGAIAVALAHSLPAAQIVALDISPDALEVAGSNANAHGVAGRIRFLESDLLGAVSGERFDCIVANPPYIADTDQLEPQVALWEPHAALFAGEDGLAMYRRLLPQTALLLKPGGLLALEFGAGQRDALIALLREDPGWSEPAFVRDLQGLDRVALAMKY